MDKTADLVKTKLVKLQQQIRGEPQANWRERHKGIALPAGRDDKACFSAARNRPGAASGRERSRAWVQILLQAVEPRDGVGHPAARPIVRIARLRSGERVHHALRRQQVVEVRDLGSK